MKISFSHSFAWLNIGEYLQSALYYILLLVVPLAMAIFFPLFSPFVEIKYVYLTSLSALIFLLWSFSFFLKKKAVLPKRFYQLIAPAWILFLILLIISLFGFDFSQSFFGSYDRRLGLISFFWLACLYSFIVYRFGSFYHGENGNNDIYAWQKNVHISFSLAVLAGTITSLYSFLQFCGLDWQKWQESQLYSRAIGNFGQPNFLAAFLLISLPLTIYLFLKNKKFLSRSLYAISFLVQLGGLILSGSRSAWIAASLSILVAVAVFLWRRHRKWLYALPLLALALGLFWYLLMPTRVASLLSLQQGSSALRLYFYKAGVQAFLQHPFLGVGLENGSQALSSFYNPQWGVFMSPIGSTDFVHNLFLDVGIQGGVVVLAFLIFLFYFLFQKLKKLSQEKEFRLFSSIIGLVFFSYFVNLLFSLPDISSLFYIFVLAALLAAAFSFFPYDRGKKLSLPPFWRYLLLSLAVLISLGQLYFSISSWQADYYFLRFQKAVIKDDSYQAYVLYRYAISASLDPSARHFYQRNALALVINNPATDLSRRALFSSWSKEISPADLGRGYEADLLRASNLCYQGDLSSADVIFSSLLKNSPGRLLGYQQWGDCLLRSSQTDKAALLYQRLLTLLPSASDPRFEYKHLHERNLYASYIYSSLAQAFLQEGKEDKAALAFRDAYRFDPSNLNSLFEASKAYFLSGQDREAEKDILHLNLRQSGNYKWPLALAYIYNSRGQKSLAKEFLDKASTLAGKQLKIPSAWPQ